MQAADALFIQLVQRILAAERAQYQELTNFHAGEPSATAAISTSFTLSVA